MVQNKNTKVYIYFKVFLAFYRKNVTKQFNKNSSIFIVKEILETV